MKVHILCQFLKNVQASKPDKNIVHGDLYGLVQTENIYIFSCCLTSHQVQHDPTLILPSSFVKVGSLICSTKEQPVPSLLAGQVSLVYSDSLVLYLCENRAEGTVKKDFNVFEETDILEYFTIVKIAYSFPILCGNKTADVKSFISGYKDEIFSNAAHFKLHKSNVIINGDSTLSKYEYSKTIGDLADCQFKKSSVNGYLFELFFNRSVINSRSAPVLRIDNNKFRIIKSFLKGEVGIYLPKNQKLSTIAPHLSKAIACQLQLAEYWILKQLNDSSLMSPIKTYLMNPIEIGNIMMPIYPSDINETKLTDYIKQIHQTFLFPLIRPMIRKVFSMQREKMCDVLINPHLNLSGMGVKDGEQSLVKGFYGYHHYMQDGIDDNRWGCAYRSLQTLISWFRMQGYTDKPIPTHREIQQILVDIKDKPSTFVGSRQWIGSTEVGFILETYLDVSSRFITVNSGVDIADHGRDLSIHFQTAGTPIMIGGGVLAHTIIGVDWNSSSGDIKYLILDPHYTGKENIIPIVKQGWCGWKGQSFWNTKAYYNLCLPQRPICV